MVRVGPQPTRKSSSPLFAWQEQENRKTLVFYSSFSFFFFLSFHRFSPALTTLIAAAHSRRRTGEQLRKKWVVCSSLPSVSRDLVEVALLTLRCSVCSWDRKGPHWSVNGRGVYTQNKLARRYCKRHSSMIMLACWRTDTLANSSD